MKLRRKHFEQYKKGMCTLKIGVDKYIWFKNPKHIKIEILRIILKLIILPFFITVLIVFGLLDFIKTVIFSTVDCLKQFAKQLFEILPSYVEITDESVVIEVPFVTPKDKR